MALVLRHSCAMALRRAGVDRAVLALWLGHEQVDTTDIYAHADLTIKGKRSPAPDHPTSIAAATDLPTTPRPSYQASDYGASNDASPARHSGCQSDHRIIRPSAESSNARRPPGWGIR